MLLWMRMVLINRDSCKCLLCLSLLSGATVILLVDRRSLHVIRNATTHD